MKKFIYALSAILFSSLFVSAQNFEGKIVYQNVVKSKIPNVADAQFVNILGKSTEYYIKNGDYKSILKGASIESQQYLKKENKLYTKMANSDTFLWNDGAKNPDEVLKVELNKGVLTVAGFKCDEIILTCLSGVQKYYFNSKVGIDSDLFINHKFGNWYDFISKSKALPLKYSIENSQFILESTATSVQNLVLDELFFQLPANAKTLKNEF